MLKSLKAAAKLIGGAAVAAAIMISQVDAQVVPKTEPVDARGADGRPLVTPPPSFIDHAVDKAVVAVRNLAKKHPKRIPGWVLDGVERGYRVYRNEQELAVWRARARQIIADLALLAEALDAHVDDTAAVQDKLAAEQIAFAKRLDAIEQRMDASEAKIDGLDKRVTAIENTPKVLPVAAKVIQEVKPRTVVIVRERPATPPQEPAPAAVQFRIPGDTMTDADRAKVFALQQH